MAEAKSGDTVKVHYTGKLDDGTVFDTSSDGDPLEFKLGEEEVIPGFEAAVIGMQSGEQKTVSVPSADAYGPRADEMVAVVKRSELPPNISLEVGITLKIPREDGKFFMVTVTGETEEEVTLDGNHPLAGKDLTFEIELVEICA
ncbi:MAG: FKBP-type peptidyl-prolyl cis-trans isomerase [Planctomycetota bacterium]